MTKCDYCKGKIEKEHSLKIPEQECQHCNSEIYSEYCFCSLSCVYNFIHFRKTGDK